MAQAWQRDLEPSPINTFKRWKGLGRTVKKGEKAIWLTIPMLVNIQDKETDEKTSRTLFIMKPRFFLASQTESENGSDWRDLTVTTPEWDKTKAWEALDITEKPYDLLDGNCGGYAVKRTLSVNPLHPNPHRIYFHEAAHIVLGHTAERDTVNTEDRTPRDIKELEAELVSYLCCISVKSQAGADQSRGYVQHWYKNNTIPVKSAQRILKTTDTIIQAGRV